MDRIFQLLRLCEKRTSFERDNPTDFVADRRNMNRAGLRTEYCLPKYPLVCKSREPIRRSVVLLLLLRNPERNITPEIYLGMELKNSNESPGYNSNLSKRTDRFRKRHQNIRDAKKLLNPVKRIGRQMPAIILKLRSSAFIVNVG